MADQSAFGSRKVHRVPGFDGITKIARVTSTKDFHKYARIEVIFIDYGQPMPVWVVGDTDREPVEGDQVIIGYIDGRKDAPYLIGFVKNHSYTTNFIVVKKDKIKLQLPIMAVGTKDGVSHKDVQGNLLDNGNQEQRAYIELAETHAMVSFPTTQDGNNPAPATIEMTSTGAIVTFPTADPAKPAVVNISASEVFIDHPTKVRVNSPELVFGDGSKQVARLGDTVEITGTDSGGGAITASGVINSASTKVKIE
jgi:hypothetical protein